MHLLVFHHFEIALLKSGREFLITTTSHWWKKECIEKSKHYIKILLPFQPTVFSFTTIKISVFQSVFLIFQRLKKSKLSYIIYLCLAVCFMLAYVTIPCYMPVHDCFTSFFSEKHCIIIKKINYYNNKSFHLCINKSYLFYWTVAYKKIL